jgi:hypothetical protein
VKGEPEGKKKALSETPLIVVLLQVGPGLLRSDIAMIVFLLHEHPGQKQASRMAHERV